MQTEAEAKYEKANERKTRPDAQQKTLEDLMSGYAISVNTQCLVVYASDIAHTQTHARVVYSIYTYTSKHRRMALRACLPPLWAA